MEAANRISEVALAETLDQVRAGMAETGCRSLTSFPKRLMLVGCGALGGIAVSPDKMSHATSGCSASTISMTDLPHDEVSFATMMGAKAMKTLTCGIVTAIWLGLAPAASVAQSAFSTDFETLLHAGKLNAAIELAEAQLVTTPDDATARFGMGIAQFLSAVEGLGQGLHRYGLQSTYGNEMVRFLGLPFLRLPVPDNPAPEQVTYEGLRAVLAQFSDRLAVAEATLALVPDQQIDLPLHLMEIRLDLDGNGTAAPGESVGGAVYNLVMGGGAGQDEIGVREIRPIDFDQSDVPWLRGYCHLLMAMADIPLAHDWRLTFDQTFHSLFPKSTLPSSEIVKEAVLAWVLQKFEPPGFDWESWVFDWDYQPGETYAERDAREVEHRRRRAEAYAFWSATPAGQKRLAYESADNALSWGGITDAVAFIHLFHWPVVEPDRMRDARQHLLAMISLSRENWRRIRAETDDRVEWLPGPQQTSLMDNMVVTEDRVRGWNIFLDEFEAVLNGEKLIPHWRIFTPNRGINVKRMFEEPTTLDPVLLIQGTAVLPYLETGTLVQQSTAGTVLSLMGGGFFSYFVWFN